MKKPGDTLLFLAAAKENGGTLTHGMMDAIIFQNRSSSALIQAGATRHKTALRLRALSGHPLSGDDRDCLINLGIKNIRHNAIQHLCEFHGAQKSSMVLFIPCKILDQTDNKDFKNAT